jgi:hypothetical protein
MERVRIRKWRMIDWTVTGLSKLEKSLLGY